MRGSGRTRGTGGQGGTSAGRQNTRQSGQGGGQGSTPVSPLMVPLLMGGLVLGFLAGYYLLWWGALVVIAVLVAAFAMVLRGRSRDGATGAIVGVLLGYLGVILVALFRGVL